MASVIALIVLFNSTFLADRLNNDHYVGAFFLLSLSIAVLLLIVFFAQKLNECPKTTKRYVYILFVSALLILQFLISTHVMGANGVDDFDVRIQATKLSFNHFEWSSYFTDWAPQNVGSTIFFSILLKISYALVGLKYATAFVNFCVMLLLDFALFIGWHTTRLFDTKHLSIHPQDIFFCLALLFSPVYLTALIMYTDPLSLCAITFSIYCYCRYIIKNNNSIKSYIWIIFASFFAMVAGYLKMNAIILIIALLLNLLISCNFKLSKKILLIFIIALTCFVTNYETKTINQAYHFHENQEKTFPLTYWIAMGLNKKTNGTNRGLFDYPGSLPSKTARAQYENKTIKSELEHSTIHEFLLLFYNKICIQWSRGTMGIGNRTYSITPQTNTYYRHIMGSSRGWLNNESQIIYILLWFGTFVNCCSKILYKKDRNSDQIIVLFIIGIFIFHTLMWEVMSRYAYLVAIPLMTEGSLGISLLFTKVLMRQEELRLKYWPLAIAVAITIGAFTNASQITRQLTPYENIVVGQNFFRIVPVSINPHQFIKERLYISQPFNKIQLTNMNLRKDQTCRIILKSEQNGSTTKLSALQPNLYSGSPGHYQLTIENTDNKPQVIPLLHLPPMDILQSMSNIKNCYISFDATTTVLSPLISPKLYWGSYLAVLISLIMVFISMYQDKNNLIKNPKYNTSHTQQ